MGGHTTVVTVALGAVLAGVDVGDVLVARPTADGGLVVVVQPGRKYVYSADQVAAAMGAQAAPSQAVPSLNGASAPIPAPTPAPGGQARKVGKLGATARKGPKA